MKRLLLVFLSLPLLAQSQCDIFFSDSVLYSCANTQVEFTANAVDLGTSFEDCDFNSITIPPGWSVSGGTSFGQPCLPSLDGSPYFWASTAGAMTPSVTTTTYSFSTGGSISFDLVYAVQGGASPCEGPDLASEGVVMQYSIDGGVTWVDFSYFNPSGVIEPVYNSSTMSVASGPTNFTSWANYTIQIPPGSITPSTMFRWSQPSSSGSCCDNWGIDNIQIFGSNDAYSINWSTGAIDTTLISVSSAVDTFYIASAYDSLGTLQCQDTCYLNIYSGGFDNGIQMVSASYAIGQSTHSIIDAYNSGCPATNGMITVVLDTALTFVNSLPPPANISGDTLEYSYSGLEFNGGHHIIYLNTITSSFMQIGDSVSVELLIEDIIGDADPSDNVKDYSFPVQTSYDPNDKKVYPVGDCTPGYVLNDQMLTYTVRFQNTGTASAINVRLEDVLSPALDPSTLKVVAASDEVELNWTSANTVEFLFNDINLPYQAVNAFGSIGYVVFEIDQVQGLAHGVEILNDVAIYFDVNPAIITNEVMNTVSDGTHMPIGDTTEITVPSIYVWNGDTLTTSGLYSSVLPTPNGCDSTAYLNIIMEDELGLGELEKEHRLVIYPNPNTGQFQLIGLEGEGELKIVNTLGELIHSAQIDLSKSIDLNGLAKGIYYVDVLSETGRYYGKVIVK